MDKIFGLEKMSLVDFDGKICATLFTASCNFRCPFCHNSSLVLDYNNLESYTFDEIYAYLEKRVGMLDAVCITGGEPTMFDCLEEVIDKVKSMGYLVKLDTNGTNPTRLKSLLDNKKVDYVAMDVKNSLAKYPITAGITNNKLIDKVLESMNILKESGVDFEFRCTLVDELHKEEDIKGIGELVKGAKKFVFQKFTDKGSCIESGLHPVSDDNVKKFKEIMETYVPVVELRGY